MNKDRKNKVCTLIMCLECPWPSIVKQEKEQRPKTMQDDELFFFFSCGSVKRGCKVTREEPI